MSCTRSRVARLTRSGFASAREAVETATPAACATSTRVTPALIGWSVARAIPSTVTRLPRCPRDAVDRGGRVTIIRFLSWKLWQEFAIICHMAQVETELRPGWRAYAVVCIGGLAYVVTVLQRTTFGVAGIEATDRYG